MDIFFLFRFVSRTTRNFRPNQLYRRLRRRWMQEGRRNPATTPSSASAAEIRSAYRNLALKWHPDRWTKESPAAAVEAKRKFQLIQEAYSVLSDNGKRAMYDAGLFDPVDDDDDDQDFTDFMGEMLAMMDSVKPEKPDSLEDLQRIFEDIVGGVGTGDVPWRTTPDVPPRRAGGYFAR